MMMMMSRQHSSSLQRLLVQPSRRTLSAAAATSLLSSLSLWTRGTGRSRPRHYRPHSLVAANDEAFFSSSSKIVAPGPLVVSSFSILRSSWRGCIYMSNSNSMSLSSLSSSSSFTTASLQQRSIRVLYASAGGTTQLFAMHLVEQLQNHLQALSSAAPVDVSLESLADYPTLEYMLNASSRGHDSSKPPPLYLFLLPTAGVGEPPGMAKKWYESLMSHDATTAAAAAAAAAVAATNANANPSRQQPLLDYAIFGLGNSLAHPHHYNSVSKNVDKKLQELNCKAFLPLSLGDDGDCIEDDFDKWEALVLQTITQNASNDSAGQAVASTGTAAPGPPAEKEKAPVVVAASAAASATPPVTTTPAATAVAPGVRSCPGSTSPCGTRTVSAHDDKLPFLRLQAPTTEIVRPHLLDVAPSWYQNNVTKCPVLEQVLLNENAAANGLRELRLQLAPNVEYQAGDHFILYPRNNDYVVEAYLRTLLKNVHPHAIIQGPADSDNHDNDNHSSSSSSKKKYPHPTGITVYETLSHCVDLGATPSPSFSRLLTGSSPSSSSDQHQFNYKKDIVGAGRTTLDLALEHQKDEENNTLSLEDVLYNLPPLQPRYYSIASSHLLHPDKVFLTYRPIRYLTNRGHLREGLCTSFLVGLQGSGKGGDGKGSFVLGAIQNNPTFRLPADSTKSIVLIAGGCGVGPIRAFLEERLELLKSNKNNNNTSKQPFFGDGLLFLGFRTPQDAVYEDLIQQALDAGALTSSNLSFDTGLPMADPRRGNVTQSLAKHGLALWQHFENGGYTYVCGGARTMGAAVERQILEILTQHGNMTPDDATKYMRNMITEGRLCEDLAD